MILLKIIFGCCCSRLYGTSIPTHIMSKVRQIYHALSTTRKINILVQYINVSLYQLQRINISTVTILYTVLTVLLYLPTQKYINCYNLYSIFWLYQLSVYQRLQISTSAKYINSTLLYSIWVMVLLPNQAMQLFHI